MEQSESELAQVRGKLNDARLRVAQLEEELLRLERPGQLDLPTTPRCTPTPQTPEEKVALFLELFGTRRSVFPKRWENTKTGESGYAPACDNEWRPGTCRKPQIKCTECPHQKFPPLDERAIEAHLRGIHALGVYAITADNTCRFLAADFDGEGWKENITAFREAAGRAGVPVAIERSRSGNGGHAWIFFSESVPASLARKLGAILLAKTAALRPTIGVETFDRFFPNQDVVSAGGFGNLIALPLAKQPRLAGNAVFVDSDFRPIADQWLYLAGLQRLSHDQLEHLVTKLAPLAQKTSAQEEDFVLQFDEATLNLARPLITSGMMSGEVTIRLDSKVHIPRAIPVPVLAALKRLACFANPVFHEKLRLRFPTFDTPRFLFAGEWHADRLTLPRGVLEQSLKVLEDAGAAVSVQDERDAGTRCAWKFVGELRPEQHAAERRHAPREFAVERLPHIPGRAHHLRRLQRHPHPTLGVPGHVSDDGMHVQLRIKITARVVEKERRHQVARQPHRLRVVCLAATLPHDSPALQLGDRVELTTHLLIARDDTQHADILRRRDLHIEERHTLGRRVSVQAQSRPRITPHAQSLELLRPHCALQLQQPGRLASPDAFNLLLALRPIIILPQVPRPHSRNGPRFPKKR
jgi:hypothetical protein